VFTYIYSSLSPIDVGGEKRAIKRVAHARANESHVYKAVKHVQNDYKIGIERDRDNESQNVTFHHSHLYKVSLSI